MAAELWLRQGVATATAAVARGRAAVAAEATTTVGLLPQPSTSNHSRGSSLLSFSNDG